jgi:hypothetical protein
VPEQEQAPVGEPVEDTAAGFAEAPVEADARREAEAGQVFGNAHESTAETADEEPDSAGEADPAAETVNEAGEGPAASLPEPEVTAKAVSPPLSGVAGEWQATLPESEGTLDAPNAQSEACGGDTGETAAGAAAAVRPSESASPEMADEGDPLADDGIVTVLGEEGRKNAAPPGWLASLVVMLVLLVTGLLVLFYVLPAGEPEARTKLASPGPVSTAGTVSPDPQAHPMTRYIEVTGLRIVVDLNRKSTIQYLVVNHAAAEVAALNLNVVIRSAANDQPVCSFATKMPSLGPYESREFIAGISTPVRALEMPDWPNLRADVTVTAP